MARALLLLLFFSPPLFFSSCCFSSFVDLTLGKRNRKGREMDGLNGVIVLPWQMLSGHCLRRCECCLCLKHKRVKSLFRQCDPPSGDMSLHASNASSVYRFTVAWFERKEKKKRVASRRIMPRSAAEIARRAGPSAALVPKPHKESASQAWGQVRSK